MKRVADHAALFILSKPSDCREFKKAKAMAFRRALPQYDFFEKSKHAFYGRRSNFFIPELTIFPRDAGRNNKGAEYKKT